MLTRRSVWMVLICSLLNSVIFTPSKSNIFSSVKELDMEQDQRGGEWEGGRETEGERKRVREEERGREGEGEREE